MIINGVKTFCEEGITEGKKGTLVSRKRFEADTCSIIATATCFVHTSVGQSLRIILKLW